MISPSYSSIEAVKQFKPVYDILNNAIDARTFPGCAFGVLRRDGSGNKTGGEVLLQDALGHFTYEEDSPPVTPQTLYDIASLTKVVATTAAAMLLVQRVQVDLDAPLGELLPGFVIGRAPGSHAHHVKVRHLLAHNSGLPGYVEFFRTATSPAELFRNCLELPLESDPGARSEYSDPGFMLLGKALEVVVKEPLADWVGREIFASLGLDSTIFCPPAASRGLIPPSEEDTSFRQRRIQGEVQDENAWLLKGAAGHAGLFSNVPDLLQFGREILRAAEADQSGGLFDPSIVEIFAERQSPQGSSRALGWDTPSANSSAGKHFSSHSIGHLGFSGCSLWIDLDAQIVVTLLTNRTWPDRSNQAIKAIRPAFHDAVREAL
jgi:CubicO group peptidase (beta-lactamase class C family)